MSSTTLSVLSRVLMAVAILVLKMSEALDHPIGMWQYLKWLNVLTINVVSGWLSSCRGAWWKPFKPSMMVKMEATGSTQAMTNCIELRLEPRRRLEVS
jgi:hypothetical protein